MLVHFFLTLEGVFFLYYFRSVYFCTVSTEFIFRVSTKCAAGSEVCSPGPVPRLDVECRALLAVCASWAREGAGIIAALSWGGLPDTMGRQHSQSFCLNFSDHMVRIEFSFQFSKDLVSMSATCGAGGPRHPFWVLLLQPHGRAPAGRPGSWGLWLQGAWARRDGRLLTGTASLCSFSL